ncbi:MAG: acyl-CoA dehydrogenase [Gammaproteobacteria bacterium]|jgi:alkylation response protein AidB-like acyl-CoA dehydrogenase|tara:strand:- start:10806 stop:12593 length:1788 start_codon:yes stop_codon:yes gene_type:complete
MSLLINPRDMDFVLYELLDAEHLTQSDIYADLDRDTFNAVIDTAKKLAEDKFEPFAAKLDANEPTFDGNVVHIIPEVKEALDAYVEAGFMGIAADAEDGGMQLPWVIAQAACAYIAAADVSANAYPFLTHAGINVLSTYGSKPQKDKYLKPLIEGRFFGTMCLSEPQAGSSLSDIKLKAEKTNEEHYSISGTKMWISAGEHELSENIVHLVLAKIPGAPPGVRGISLFIVPKYRVNDDGKIGDRNNIELAGLNHKMGFRGTTNTVLNFGEHGECQGFLVGEEHQGLFYMFDMMNEARIGVGMTATVLGYSGYLHSLDYARKRPQGRAIDQKNPTSPQVEIIEHADIKRLLLAQKSAVEASFFLVLYCSSLLDRLKISKTESEKNELSLLLEILTPIAKSWPSEFCLEANKHAIQILGGYGYTRDFPLERFYRDNRLNPIHEGTHGIQGLDLLGRKVVMQDGAAFKALLSAYRGTIESAKKNDELNFYVELFSSAIQKLEGVTSTLASPESGSILDRTANATIYLDAFGHIVISWMWLRQIEVAVKNLMGSESDFYHGKMKAAEYFFRYELPKAIERLEFLERIDTTCVQMENNWF